MLQATTRLVAQPNVASDIIDGETVLLPPHPGNVLVLNEVGTAVWQLAAGGCTLLAIIERICATYSVERAVAEADVRSFVDELARRNLVSFEQHQG